eukprot:189021-Amphidinium_carterae.1
MPLILNHACKNEHAQQRRPQEQQTVTYTTRYTSAAMICNKGYSRFKAKLASQCATIPMQCS